MLFRLIAILFVVFFSFACDNGTDTELPPSRQEAPIVQVTLNDTIRFQTMRGFGGFGAKRVWWDQEPFYDDGFVNTLINDLGITILRDNIPIAFEPENDNDDPYDLDMSRFNLTTDYPGVNSHMGQHIPYLKAMHEAGLKTFIATIWSPPVWMKYNNFPGNGTANETSAPEYSLTPDANTNQLREDMYEELAEYCIAYIKTIKEETGMDVYAISVQNEPRFSQFYASSVHSFESLKDLIKVVGARFEQEGVPTKIFMPEDVQSIWHIRQYLDAILNDPEANRYVDIFAIHNYRNNGVDPSDEGPQNWQETYQKALSGNKEVWMTETSGFDGATMDGGMNLARSIYNALYYGNAVAWVYWQMSDGNDSPLLSEGTDKNYLYFVSKHFYRHIRPNAVRFAIESGHPDVLSLAFFDPSTEHQTLILINLSQDIVEVQLTGPAVKRSYTGYQTSFTRRHEAYNAPITGQGDLFMDGNSIVTLVHTP